MKGEINKEKLIHKMESKNIKVVSIDHAKAAPLGLLKTIEEEQ